MNKSFRSTTGIPRHAVKSIVCNLEQFRTISRTPSSTNFYFPKRVKEKINCQ